MNDEEREAKQLEEEAEKYLKNKDFHDGWLARNNKVIELENEISNLQQQSHDQVNIIEYVEQQLAKELELRKELVEAVEGLSRYESAKEFDKLQELIKRAK